MASVKPPSWPRAGLAPEATVVNVARSTVVGVGGWARPAPARTATTSTAGANRLAAVKMEGLMGGLLSVSGVGPVVTFAVGVVGQNPAAVLPPTSVRSTKPRPLARLSP